ncbi:polysaccharide pyruvyl transferase family protein [Leucobacter sp. NPDC058333]|uniref:polysaccharide pyruvyl transferase family protein n=1 Tax=Leucobacter sp. NPDC058333 TaxID=3346450 RepID=UPI0036493E7B
MTVHLTHGAKKNVGDYLIHSRARKLWKHVAPEVEIASIARWIPEELPNDSRLLVMCGGPGFTPRLVEGVFPVVQRAGEHGIPVSGLALGWQGLPKRNPGSFTMTARSVATLRAIAASGSPISVRDDVTQEIAEQFGIESVRTGCTAWYSIPDLGSSARIASAEPRSIVYTTPALDENAAQSLAVMRMLRTRFPAAKLYASFHRGIEADELTTKPQSKILRRQAKAAKSLGFEVLDVAYDLGRIGFYRDIDLHVGYRVHAHLDFVSRRSPSVLISEDGRGFGQTATLHGRKQVLWSDAQELVPKLERRITAEIEKEWPSLTRAIETIEASYPVMRDVIKRQAQLAAGF